MKHPSKAEGPKVYVENAIASMSTTGPPVSELDRLFQYCHKCFKHY